MKEYSTCPNAPNIFHGKSHLKKNFKTYCDSKIDTEKGLHKKDIRAIQSLVMIEDMMNSIEADYFLKMENQTEVYIQLSAEARNLKQEIFN